MNYYLEPMRQDDVPDVSRVERECFSNPWPQSAYRRELRNPANNHYVVLRHHVDRPVTRPGRGESRGPLALLPFVRKPDPATVTVDPIVGFAGMWVLFDEAHVTTIGVVSRHRGKGLGELMLIDLFEEAARRGAEWLTLEVRVSNESAQSLYHKYGFTRQGLRRRYYSDNGEDAYIMWSPSLKTPEFNERFERLRGALRERLRGGLLARSDSPNGEVAS